MKRVFLGTAALAAAVAVWGLLLPPRRLSLDRSVSDGSVRGILHVHSRLSDGRGTLEQIAAAAARAGLAFVVVTDHGDATRVPEPPAYISGVLCIDAVEISTRQGHYVAIGLPQAPYPLGGEARDVVEDVHRLGGFGIAAHPDSPKAELRWSDWTGAPVDAVELINPDTSWRVHAFARGPSGWGALLRALLAYPARPAETVAQLLTDNTPLQQQWRRLLASRAVVALAGADAHAKLALSDAEPGDQGLALPIPSYESSFASLSVHVVPSRPLSGDAAADAGSLLEGLRAGHTYIAVDGWATPAGFTFAATGQGVSATAGDTVRAGTPLTLQVRSNAPSGYTTTVRRDDAVIAESSTETEVRVAVDGGPAVYTAEVRAPGHGPSWITSNPIYVRPPTAHVAAPASGVALTPAGRMGLFDGRTTNGWAFEHDPTSLAVVESVALVQGPRIRLRYGLSGGARQGQYAAAAVDLPGAGVEAFDGLTFSLRGEQPMRVSVQARAEMPDGTTARWERSVYVDATERAYAVPFSEMRPVGHAGDAVVPRARLRAVMFVIDTTNAATGASGRLWIGEPALARRRR